MATYFRRMAQRSYLQLLGLTQRSPVALAKRVREGLSFHAFQRFQRNTRFSAQQLAEVADIKLRTLHRRRAQGRLAPEESDRLLRFSRVFGAALELFEGDVEAARGWFTLPQRALAGERPMALAQTDEGAGEIEALIGRLEQGIAS